MTRLKSLSEWMAEQNLDLTALTEASGLDRKVVEAIASGRYTTSPRQRERLAQALKVSPDDIRWSQTVHVDHLYGHGPQFGRSP